MVDFSIIINFFQEMWLGKITKVVLILACLIIAYVIFNTILKKLLMRKVNTKKMRHNVIMFTHLVSYIFIFLAILFIVLSFTGNFLSLGLTAGLLTAALGWALQRPISGVAAWIVVMITKPFEIGDRIVVGSVRGDVVNITITHIHLSEFGGTVGGEETSGRIVIIPNSILFEQNVINYTAQNEYILDEVAFTITYKSHIELAKKIAKKVAEDVTKDFIEYVPKQPFTRSNFQASGVDVRIRYYTIASRRQEIQSKITEEIFKQIMKEKKVEFAYHHTQVVFEKERQKVFR